MLTAMSLLLAPFREISFEAGGPMWRTRLQVRGIFQGMMIISLALGQACD